MQTLSYIESPTIPEGVTIAQYRRARRAAPRPHGWRLRTAVRALRWS